MRIIRTWSLLAMAGALLWATPASAAATAPDLTWTTNDGTTVHLYDKRGSFVVLNFFAAWCDACRWEQQAFVNASHAYQGRGVTFVGVDVGGESVQTVTAYAEQRGIDYPLVIDSQLVLDAEYHISELPTTFFIDPSGRIAYSTEGALDYGDLTATLEKVFGISP